jgi:hypothetical protein
MRSYSLAAASAALEFIEVDCIIGVSVVLAPPFLDAAAKDDSNLGRLLRNIPLETFDADSEGVIVSLEIKPCGSIPAVAEEFVFIDDD